MFKTEALVLFEPSSTGYRIKVKKNMHTKTLKLHYHKKETANCQGSESSSAIEPKQDLDTTIPTTKLLEIAASLPLI